MLVADVISEFGKLKGSRWAFMPTQANMYSKALVYMQCMHCIY